MFWWRGFALHDSHHARRPMASSCTRLIKAWAHAGEIPLPRKIRRRAKPRVPWLSLDSSLVHPTTRDPRFEAVWGCPDLYRWLVWDDWGVSCSGAWNYCSICSHLLLWTENPTSHSSFPFRNHRLSSWGRMNCIKLSQCKFASWTENSDGEATCSLFSSCIWSQSESSTTWLKKPLGWAQC